MTIEPGTRIGAYLIESKLGAGGMGEVYRARDTGLDREVAIKVLPETFAGEPDRLARFEREARVLATLNHSNIAQIYGLERSGDSTDAGPASPVLVLELVDGSTLADRVGQGAIQLDEALPIARQIAQALEGAHEQGVVHRDLKPANIKITPDGVVKVLDFGLAKAIEGASGPGEARVAGEHDPANSPTMTASATQMGMILGTAAYMSPEQARGKPVDRRTDVWAFGVVLYEMLTGRRAFEGEDVSLTLSQVLQRDPDWSALPEGLPAGVTTALRRCLEKDPARRIRDVGDVQLAMDGAFDGSPDAAAASGGQTTAARSAALLAGIGVAGLVVGGLLAALIDGMAPAPAPRLERFAVSGVASVSASSRVPQLAISRDGSKLAWRSGPQAPVGGRLYVRGIGDVDPTLIEAPTDVHAPVFSPNGESIVYLDGRTSELKRVSVRGGTPLTICPVEGTFAGASWADDDSLVFIAGANLFRVPAAGGVADRVLDLGDVDEGVVLSAWPDVLPGGRVVLYTALDDGGGIRIRAVDLDTGDAVVVVPAGMAPRYVPTGHLVYAVDDTLWAVAFDAVRLQAEGAAVPVLEGVGSYRPTAMAQYSLSDEGSLVYVSSAADAGRTFVWVDRDGTEAPLSLPPREYLGPRLSPDGRRLAVRVPSPGSEFALWVFDVASAAGLRLTHEGNANTVVWTPDGEHLVFTWNDPPGGGFWDAHVARADGSGEIRRLTTTPDANEQPTSVTPDGRSVVTVRINGDGSRDIVAIPFDGDGEIVPILEGGGFARGNAALSPDGIRLAYRSDQSGQMEIYLQPYPGPGPTTPVSVGGGDMVTWSPDGSELFYRRGSAVMAAPVDVDGRVGRVVQLFDSEHFDTPGGVRQYHVAPDGRFLMMQDGGSEPGGGARVVLVQNWVQELRARVPPP